MLEEKIQTFLNATGALETCVERNTGRIEANIKQAKEDSGAVQQRLKTVERSLAIKVTIRVCAYSACDFCLNLIHSMICGKNFKEAIKVFRRGS